jgi:hypothetical protein
MPPAFREVDTNLGEVGRIAGHHPERAPSAGQRYACSHRRQNQVHQQLLAGHLHHGDSAVVWTICAGAISISS